MQCLPTPTKLEPRNAVDVNTYRSKQIFPIRNDSVYTLHAAISTSHATAQSLITPYPPFECQSEGKGIRWTNWITRLTNNVFVGYNITDDARKKALMLMYAGEDPNDIFDTLSIELVTTQPGTDETVFRKVVEALDVYFNPKQNKEFQRYVFRQTNQERFEYVDKFYMRLFIDINMQFHINKK